MRIKGNCLQFTRNHHHLSLASLAWILRTLHSYQVSCHLFSDLLPSSHKRKTPRLELNTFPRSVLPPVDQPDSTSISGEQQTLTVTARSYCPLNSFQTGSIPQVYLHEIETPGNTDTHTHTHARSNEGRLPKDPNNDPLGLSIFTDQIKQLIDYLKNYFLDLLVPRKNSVNLSQP